VGREMSMRTYFEDAIPWAFGTREDSEEWHKLPFLGFLAGSVISAGIWGVLAVAWWAWQQFPI
jgi:hypothetical protein